MTKENRIGAWGSCPFDNEPADYALLLDRTEPEARESLLRGTLPARLTP
ncbi:hypothetical protein [Streptomyces sp. NPDC102462]